MPGGFMPGANEPCPMPKLTYASASARCQASSPSDRPPASGRKSYWPGGKAFSSTTVFLASRSQTSRNVCSSLPGIDEYSPLKVGRIPRNKLTARPAPTSDRNTHLISEWCTRRHMSVLERCGSNQLIATGQSCPRWPRSEEHTSELQSLAYLVCRLLLEKKKKKRNI